MMLIAQFDEVLDVRRAVVDPMADVMNVGELGAQDGNQCR